MIVDMIRNDIGRIARIGTIHSEKLFAIERYPTLFQMTSSVDGNTTASFPEIFKALFPCASITGAPKVRTMQIIDMLETLPRKIYTGAIGYIAPDRKAVFSVAIRTALIDKKCNTAEYGVGGGIVWDSKTDDEFNECKTKTRVLFEPAKRFLLYETMLWTPSEGYFLLDHHLDRLIATAKYFGFCADRAKISKHLTNLSAVFPDIPRRVRIEIDRKGTINDRVGPVPKSFAAAHNIRANRE